MSKYPFIGEHATGVSVLFLNYQYGIVVKANKTHHLLEKRDDWSEKSFKPIKTEEE
jgi:hypothetical protein